MQRRDSSPVSIVTDDLLAGSRGPDWADSRGDMGVNRYLVGCVLLLTACQVGARPSAGESTAVGGVASLDAVSVRGEVASADANGIDEVAPAEEWDASVVDAAPYVRHASTLPGESTACQALGIAACRKPACWGFDDYMYCFDAQGKFVTDYATGDDPLPCSDAQLAAWVATYVEPCWRKVSFPQTPQLNGLGVLDSAKLPAEICSNVDGTRFRFTVDGKLHTLEYSFSCPSNWHANMWELTVTPPSAAALQPGLPFLACAAFSAKDQEDESYTHWKLDATNSASETRIVGYQSYLDDKVVWSDVVAQLAAEFTACGAP